MKLSWCVGSSLLWRCSWPVGRPITNPRTAQPTLRGTLSPSTSWLGLAKNKFMNQNKKELKWLWFESYVIKGCVNNGARWIFTSFSLVIMALMLGNRFETSHYASYECGLFQKTVARVKYEITFYTVALTFLIFEYELLFIFPLLLSLQVSHKSF